MEQKEIKCNHCGHVNPPGTQLCQSCGKMINEDYDKKKIKDLMRYDGSAVRSKVRSQSIFDKIWNFFTSIKVGVGIIALIAISAALGTILPQEYFILSEQIRCSTTQNITVHSEGCIMSSALRSFILHGGSYC